jgi:hypothetical protein
MAPIPMPMEQHVREAVDTFMMRVRRDLDAHLRTLTSDLLRVAQETHETSRAELDRAVSDARADSERSFRARLESMRDELTREMERRLATERSEMQASSRSDSKASAREGRVETLERLLGAIRRIDEATTLSGILETLARGAAAETSRVAILLVEGDVLRTWGHFGFPADASPVDTLIGPSGVLAAAVALQQTSFIPPMLDSREPSTPPFMRVPVGHTGLVTPLIVAGEVVGLLYADDVDRLSMQEDAPVWTEEVELLVRHASVRLENVTSERTVEVMSRPA